MLIWFAGRGVNSEAGGSVGSGATSPLSAAVAAAFVAKTLPASDPWWKW